ncbi:hypothetical protein DFH07DRAFT_867056 [Mycena maculata]|uniref:FAD-binding domain-containing protein n=1 Tax=Mycena maculata TaxID=230809 RepID=A0AAD7JLQ2_9AGAR|nr:hypothetical protein DFH07DRAFT_867056 [Mycena maculata]
MRQNTDRVSKCRDNVEGIGTRKLTRSRREVGAGPAGLILALFLVKSGLTPRIIDKDPTFHTGSRRFGIQSRTFELLQTLGLLPATQAAAMPIPTMRAYKLPGGTIPAKTWDLYPKGRVWPDRPHANGACLGQSALEGIMRAELAWHGVEVERARELVGFTQDADGVVARIRGQDGVSHRRRRGPRCVGSVGDPFAYLSDGTAAGPTRKLLGLTIMARPLAPGGKTFGIGTTGLNFDPVELADEVKVKGFIHEQTRRTDLVFGEFSWLSYFKPNMRMVNKFGEGRVFLVGDAAHVHSPTGGQGMNTSVQDSSNLAWKLALVLKGQAPPVLFETYNTERLPIVAQMLLATSALYTHTVAQVPPSQATETKVVEPEDENASGWLLWRNSALEMYGINYRYSPLVFDNTAIEGTHEEMRARAYEGYEGSGTLRAGDRAPEAPGLLLEGNATSLFGLFDPALHTVLVFLPTKEGALAKLEGVTRVVAAYPAGTVQPFTIYKDRDRSAEGGRGARAVVDVDGHAFAAYLIGDDEFCVVVVRPDGFIGAIVSGVEGMDRYFGNIFKQ